jgi:phosphatidylethanolamine N-methyltransferase
MDETQAKRIVSLCHMAFDVEMTPDVVVADANVGLLTKRVLGARSLTEPKGVYGGGPGAKVS